MSKPSIPEPYQKLIGSARVSTATRQALQARDVQDDPAYRPATMTQAQLETLRAVIGRTVPQPAAASIDLAARLDRQLAEGQGDGWRFARLQDDRTACASGLAVLEQHARAAHAMGFVALAPELQDELLARAAAGELEPMPDLLDGVQMRLWFQDVLADTVKLYMSHPATLARIGYSGIGYGGDGGDKPGFMRLGLNEREPWEPMPQTDAATR